MYSWPPEAVGDKEGTTEGGIVMRAMKRLNRRQVRRLVGEAMKPHSSRRLSEMVVYDDVDIGDLIVFAQAWSDLGSAVQEQVRDILDDPGASVNPNAIDLAIERLGSVDYFGVTQLLEEYMNENYR
jgi:hypothetical protein